MRLFRTYKYTLYGKERWLDTGVHPLTIHYTRLGAYLSMLCRIKEYTKMYIA